VPLVLLLAAELCVRRQNFWDRKGDFRREGFGSSMRLTGESFGFACGVGKPENRVCLLGRVWQILFLLALHCQAFDRLSMRKDLALKTNPDCPFERSDIPQ
jgi:hypothetical protein